MAVATASYVTGQISIHALHEESDAIALYPSGRWLGISIHALHEESDNNPIRHIDLVNVISIHALHEESDSIPLSTA